MRTALTLALVALGLSALAGCGDTPTGSGPDGDATAGTAGEDGRPSILLVTLDTTRADVLGYAGGPASTPALDALAARGTRFAQAYTTAPTTAPAHASMLTGLLPAAHGVRENGRALDAGHPRLAARLAASGYATAAFVSGFPLAGRFGFARGFERYDDEFQSANERRAGATTTRALAYLASREGDPRPCFLWVHYFDPHEPYDPPEPYRDRHPGDPYLGEIAYMDAELGTLIDAFETAAGGRPTRILAVGDHGEGRDDHGEQFHGNLLYQATMRVPLVIAGGDGEPGTVARPVSVRRVYDTVLAWAGLDAERPLPSRAGDGDESAEPVLGEAMKPFLHYGWQPQVMAVHGRLKAIRSGELEVYDVVADPGETRDLADTAELDRALRQALRDYPFVPDPATGAGTDGPLDDEARRRLASLGYAGWDGRATLRPDAPSPKDMTHLFTDLDLASGLFVRGRYAEAIPVFERVLEADPNNLMVALRLAVAHSSLGDLARAETLFARARAIDPSSADVRHYHALHLLRAGRPEDAEPLLESVLAESPGRSAALDALARIRAGQGRLDEAIALLERAETAGATGEVPALLGELRMAIGDTEGAIAAFERAQSELGERFAHHLELGVLYLAARRFADARDALDRVDSSHPGYAMALFKRAQVAVLRDEPDAAERIRRAHRHADATTRPLIETERLFAGVAWR